MKNMRMSGMLLAAALCLPAFAAADGPEGASEVQQKALAEAQATVSGILGAERVESGVGRVLATLYQQFFVLKDAKRNNVVKLVRQKLELKNDIVRFRLGREDLAQKSDQEILDLVSSEVSSRWYTAEAMMLLSNANTTSALEAERGLIEEDIKDVEARIKDLTDKLVEEEKAKK